MKDENLEEVFKLAQEIGEAIGTYCTDEQVKLFEKILEDYKIKNEKFFKQQKIIDNAINEVEKVRQYFDDELQPEFIGILEILKDKKVIDW